MIFSRKIHIPTSANKQEGVTMVIVLVVLLVLTIIGVSATDSNSLQSLMARNNQYRLETFNASNVEIEAQYAFYEASANATPRAISPPIEELINSDIGTKLESGVSPKMVEKSKNTAFEKTIVLSKASGCPVFGSTININDGGQIGNAGALKCFLMQLDSSAEINNPKIKSEQIQTFTINTL